MSKVVKINDSSMNILDTFLKNASLNVIGKKDQLTLLFSALIAKGHVLIEDSPGMGKTIVFSLPMIFFPRMSLVIIILIKILIILSLIKGLFLQIFFWQMRSIGEHLRLRVLFYRRWKKVL